MGSDSRGSNPSMSFQRMREKARSGALAGSSRSPDDCCSGGMPSGMKNPPMAGQGTNVIKRTPINSARTGNDPWERAKPLKPGA